MKLKHSFYILLSMIFIFAFLNPVSAKTIGKRCVYNNSTDKNTIKIEIDFNFDNSFKGKWTFKQFGSKKDGVLEISLENLDSVKSKFDGSEDCPRYIMTVYNHVSFHRSFYGVYSNEEFEIIQNKVNSVTDVYADYYKNMEDIDDGTDPKGNPAKEFSKKYFPSSFSTGEFGNLNLKIIYNEVESSFVQQTLLFTKETKTPAWIYSNVENFKNDILLPIVQNSKYPTDFWCGTISSYLTIKSNAMSIGGSVTNGDIACSTNKDFFNDGTNKLIHYSEVDNGKVEEETPPVEPPVEEKPDDENNDNNGNNSNDFNNMTDITTGKICQSNNLKVPLKYIGWLLMLARIIIPIIIIGLGVVDFIKAVSSPMKVELTKPLKSITMRVIAGVVIFFVPMIVNFLFVLVDDWSNYGTHYSECTTCLFNPKKC